MSPLETNAGEEKAGAQARWTPIAEALHRAGALHVAAALCHHKVRPDATMRRMLPF